jgi:ATP-dependent RNA circularization protein (DNA/RNA ligase family)
MKPLGKKCYGSIGHLPQSRMGPADHKIAEGQAKIATEKTRDKHDVVIVQEKLDGSNVGVANIDGAIVPLTRSGYIANTSPYKMHHVFYDWVMLNKSRFEDVLAVGERICGEWLWQPHGTIYVLKHEPFVVFDIMENNTRLPYGEFKGIVEDYFVMAKVVGGASPMSVATVMGVLGTYGYHGAQEQIEGAVWRVERKGKVDFLCKYVRPDKVDGKYLELGGAK